MRYHSDALAAAGVDWWQISGLRNRHPLYDLEYRFVVAMVADQHKHRRHDEADRRAMDGVDEPVFGSLGGEAGTGEVGTRKVYSDKLLALQLTAHDRQKYAPPQSAAAINAGGNVVIHYHTGIARDPANPPPETATNPPQAPIDADFSEEIEVNDAD